MDNSQTKIRNQFIFTLVFHDKHYKKACDDTFQDFSNLINKLRNNNTSYQLKYGDKDDNLSPLDSEDDYNDMKKSKDNKVFLVLDKNDGIASLRKKMKINYRMHIMKKALSNMTHKRFARFEELSKRIAQSRDMIKFTPMKPVVSLLHSGEPLPAAVPKVNVAQSTIVNEPSKAKQADKKEKEKEKEATQVSAKLFDHKIPCDSCKKNIVGKRYLCAICNKFNMCHACKKDKDHDHEHHFFISIKNSKKYEKEQKQQEPKKETAPIDSHIQSSVVLNESSNRYESAQSNQQYKLCLANNESFDKYERLACGTPGDKNIFLEINTNVPHSQICLEKVANPIGLMPFNKLSWKLVSYIRLDIKDINEYPQGRYQQQLCILHKDPQGNCTMLSNNNINLIMDIV